MCSSFFNIKIKPLYSNSQNKIAKAIKKQLNNLVKNNLMFINPKMKNLLFTKEITYDKSNTNNYQVKITAKNS